jgi:acetate kinase
MPRPAAIGHRVVHGGPSIREHCLVDGEVLDRLGDACAFAPLHVPPALALIREAMEFDKDIPNVACIDTAFHHGLPDLARVLPVPAHVRAEGVERFGFHGLSCESIIAQLGAAMPARVVIAHLGSGASITAVRDGRSVDTSMGLTPTGGVVMATRPGDLDPGVLLYLMRAHGYSTQMLETLLDRQSGMAGISGISGDVRELQELSARHPLARLALMQFAESVAKHIAGMAIALGGADLVAFTGGIGENDAQLRDDIGRRIAPLLPSARCVVMPSQENERIAHHTRRIGLQTPIPPAPHARSN